MNIVARPTEQESPVNSSVVPGQILSPSKQEEAPFSIYAKENSVPYTAVYFGIDRDSFEGLKGADITDLVPKIESIDNYVLHKILMDDYFDSTATFKDVVQDIKEKIGIKDFEPSRQQIEKIYAYISNIGPNGKQLPEFQVKRTSKAEEINHSQFRKVTARVDKAVEKSVNSYIKRIDNQFKTIDKTLSKRMDDQLKKVAQFRKVDKIISKYFK